jgi:hypothetical protein
MTSQRANIVLRDKLTARGELGTRTATLDRDRIKKLRANWIYKIESA